MQKNARFICNTVELRQIGTEVQAVAKTVPGFEDAKLDQQSSIPQLRIEADRQRAKAYGISPGHLNEQLSNLVGGKEVAELREGQRTINLVTRLPVELRDSRDKIAALPFENGEGKRISVSMVADVREAKGPNVINRENNQRRFAIAIKPSNRDVGASVKVLQEKVAEKVKLPEGFFISYEGEFQAQKEASERIALLSGVVFIIIAFLLYGYFGLAEKVRTDDQAARSGWRWAELMKSGRSIRCHRRVGKLPARGGRVDAP